MSAENPDNNNPPPEGGIAEPELDPAVQEERERASLDTPTTRGEAAQYDSGQGLDEARAHQELKDRAREYEEKTSTFSLRQDYTHKLFTLTCIWLIFVLFFVSLTGLKGHSDFVLTGIRISLNLSDAECPGCWRFHFALSDKVLIAFITSTTASVIGIFIVVAKWLFPAPLAEKPKQEA